MHSKRLPKYTTVFIRLEHERDFVMDNARVTSNPPVFFQSHFSYSGHKILKSISLITLQTFTLGTRTRWVSVFMFKKTATLFRLTQRWSWGFHSSGTWHRFIRWLVPDVSGEREENLIYSTGVALNRRCSSVRQYCCGALNDPEGLQPTLFNLLTHSGCHMLPHILSEYYVLSTKYL